MVELDDRMNYECRKYLKSFLETNNPRAILQMNLNAFRQRAIENARIINKSVKIEGVEKQDFLVKSETDGYDVPLTAYIPMDVSTRSTSIILFIHGGGYSFGSRETYELPLLILAKESKCIWLSIEYRLAPEHKHPIGLDDCKSVAKWVVNNKCKIFNCDESAAVGICGESSGGTYAATIAHELKSKIAFQILIYPRVHLRMETEAAKEFTRDCFLSVPEVINFYVNNLIKSEDDVLDPRASPILHQDFSNLPRCCLIAAELCPMADHSRLYHKKLIENNVKRELHIIKGVQHGYFKLVTQMPNAFNETLKHIVEFINN